MTVEEAYDLMDLLIDKADHPYFNNEEKDRFLEIAILEFIGDHYKKMESDEDSRVALAGVIDYQRFEISDAEIIGGVDPDLALHGTVGSDRYNPTMEQKFPINWEGASGSVGYFTGSDNYVLPNYHLYTLGIQIGLYDNRKIIPTSLSHDGNGNLTAAEEYTTSSTLADIVYLPKGKLITSKAISSSQLYGYHHKRDPFNGPNPDNSVWCYRNNQIIIGYHRQGPSLFGGNGLRYVQLNVITRPTIAEAFSGNALANFEGRFNEYCQRQIIQLAVRKMSANIESDNYQVEQIETREGQTD